MKIFIWQGTIGYAGECYVVLAEDEIQARALIKEHPRYGIDFGNPDKTYTVLEYRHLDKPRFINYFSYFE